MISETDEKFMERMLKARAEQIPPDAMYAAWKAMNAGMTLNDAIAAAINAWPGVRMIVDIDTGNDIALRLPLPQEASDE